jgi:hypothetical protein
MTRGALALGLVSAAAALASASSADAAPPTRVLKGPYVTAFSDTTADVRFELDAPGPATLEIGPARGAAIAPVRKLTDAAATANHVIQVTGLEAGKVYAYAVSIGGSSVARGDVTTAPAPTSGAPIRFTLYGDDRSDPAAHAAVIQAIGEHPSDFLLNTGDIVEDGGSAADWQSFFTIEAPLLRSRPLLLCIGNHELYDDEAGANFARYFGFPDATGAPKPYGTARVGLARFFFLNGMHDWDSGEERAWLERELAKADAEPGLVWRIAVIHHGPWSSGPHGPNPRLIAAHVPELLAAHKVDLVVSGHDHIYERGDAGALKYLISGGGGAPLYRIAKVAPTTRKSEPAYHFIDVTATSTDIKTVAYRLDGSLLEKCGFVRGQAWDCDPPPSPAAVAPAPASLQPASSPAPPAHVSRCTVAAPGLASSDRAASGVAAGLALAAWGCAIARRRRGRRRS